MDSAAVTAVIAASLSIVSVAANLYIARAARQGAVDALKLKARLDHDQLVDKVIKEIDVEGERLRIRAWELIACCQSASDEGQEQLQALIEAFARQAGEFLDRWAPAKDELPLTMLEILRVLRHDCRKEIETVRALGRRIASEIQLTPSIPGAFIETLIRLLEKIDNFTSKISQLRRDRLLGAFGSDDPLWRLAR
jgi:hypothetical protein